MSRTSDLSLFESMVAEMDFSEEAKGKRSSLATRKASHRDMLEHVDLDRLVDMKDKMTRAVDVMTANQIDLDEPGILTTDEVNGLMSEELELTEIKELLEARREMRRAAIFAHITEDHRRGGESDPENTPGFISVPAFGKRFVKEGCGRSKPQLDEEKFKEELGDRWEQAYQATIIPRQVIPEHIEYTLSQERILAMAERDPGVLETIRACLIPGEYRTPRFVVRDD